MPQPKFVRYRSVVSVIDRKSVEESYSWEAYLEKILVKLDRPDKFDCRCTDYVVPAQCFYQAPFAEYMKYIDSSVKVSSDFEYRIVLKLF